MGPEACELRTQLANHLREITAMAFRDCLEAACAKDRKLASKLKDKRKKEEDQVSDSACSSFVGMAPATWSKEVSAAQTQRAARLGGGFAAMALVVHARTERLVPSLAAWVHRSVLDAITKLIQGPWSGRHALPKRRLTLPEFLVLVGAFRTNGRFRSTVQEAAARQGCKLTQDEAKVFEGACEKAKARLLTQNVLRGIVDDETWRKDLDALRGRHGPQLCKIIWPWTPPLEDLLCSALFVEHVLLARDPREERP